jgi:molecular chaperone HscB
LNYFELFNCAVAFDLTEEQLKQIKQRFYQLQKQYHPDRFTNYNAQQKLEALQKSSFINDAYKTLIDPIARGLYLLKICDSPLQLEFETHFSSNFLCQLMEWQEEQTSLSVQEILHEHLMIYQQKMNEAFIAKNWSEFRVLLKQSLMVQKLIQS